MSVTIKSAWIGFSALILAALITGAITYFNTPASPEQKAEGDCSPNLSGVTVGNDLKIDCEKKP